MTSQDIEAVIAEFLPICKSLADGRYAISIGGSRARNTSDELSDIDFRLFCDALVQDPGERARLEAQLDEAVQRWAERGVIIDGCWIATSQRPVPGWSNGMPGPANHNRWSGRCGATTCLRTSSCKPSLTTHTE